MFTLPSEPSLSKEPLSLPKVEEEKVQMKKTIKAHQEKKTKQSAEAPEDAGAVPAYLLDREQQTQAKAISSMVKQKRKEKEPKRKELRRKD